MTASSIFSCTPTSLSTNNIMLNWTMEAHPPPACVDLTNSINTNTHGDFPWWSCIDSSNCNCSNNNNNEPSPLQPPLLVIEEDLCIVCNLPPFHASLWDPLGLELDVSSFFTPLAEEADEEEQDPEGQQQQQHPNNNNNINFNNKTAMMTRGAPQQWITKKQYPPHLNTGDLREAVKLESEGRRTLSSPSSSLE
eukprot:GEZU01023654.1.p2 GENE.GEZU01023654.1~~GEZU01023654.1.p2  ORF type:complete len:194 (+),score=51.47 GEZU01023654.1:70-651(+)